MIDLTNIIWVFIASLILERLYPGGVVNLLVQVEVVANDILVFAAPVDLHLDFEEAAPGHHE